MKPTVPKALANIVVDHDTYANEQLMHDTFQEIRNSVPLAWAEPDNYEPFWLVSRYEDIREVSRQNDLYMSGVKQLELVDNDELSLVKQLTGGSPHLFTTLIHMNGAEHRNYRALAQSWLLPKNLERWRDELKAIASEFVERMANAGGEIDFATDIAFKYPLRVIMQVFGVPPEDEHLILRWTLRIFGAYDPSLNDLGDGSRDPEAERAARYQAGFELNNYLEQVRKDRVENPRDDLASEIANGEIDGAPVPPEMATAYFMIIATAGHDTTASGTACAMWALTEFPELLPRLQEHPEKIPAFIEEVVRWATPVKHFMRSAANDTVLAGQEIKAGELLMLSYPSGNRDELVFEKPYDFNIDRKEQHTAFGYGRHICIGQHLARLELNTFWETLIPKIASVERAGPARLAAARLAGGYKNLPIRYTLK